VEYDAADAARIAGRRKDEIEVLLGDAVRPALVHRDHLVML
jgi:glutamate 5-kinase